MLGLASTTRGGRAFNDTFDLAGGLVGVVLGEVSPDAGDALARATLIRHALRAYLEAGLEPREALRVGADAPSAQLGEGFATAVVAVHDPESGRLTYACAGHPPPEVKGGPEPFEPVTACSAPPFGIGEATGFRQSTLTVPDGARACFRTHGLTDERAERVLAGARDAQSFAPRVEELEVDEREVGDALERFLRVCDVPLAEVPGLLRAAGEAARRGGSAVVRVRIDGSHPDVDVVPGGLARPAERRGRALR